ncbi:MAG: FHA domain-containing protein, partial [Rhodobacterales bacterium]|nr:FHA domain-containing protein [Rhodobacterales bacterium]
MFLRALFGKTAVEPARPAAPVETGPDPVMAALAELEVKRLRQALAAAAPAPAPAPEPELDLPSARPSRVVKTKSARPEGATGPAVNIWDMDEGTTSPVKAAEPAAAASEPERRRPTRTKTRILGFELQPASVVPLFDEGSNSAVPIAQAAVGQGHVMFPTGWLVVKSGPGHGATYALTQGVSQIGRGSDQTVALDFGDMAISRQNHAAVAYDGSTHQFHIGHG